MNTFKFTERSVSQLTEDDILQIMTYELGDIVKGQHYSKVYGPKGYELDQKQAFADLTSMIRMFCEQKGWNFEELMQVGEEHYKDRMKDIGEYGRKSGCPGKPCEGCASEGTC